MSDAATPIASESRGAGPCPNLEALEHELRAGPMPGESKDPVRAALRRHLVECSECRARFDSMRRGDEFMARFAGDPLEALRGDDLRDEFPGYAIEALIDFGGQGAVYRAREIASGEEVAIKIPLGDATRSPAKRYRLRREVELTARLDHSGIVPVRGACEGRSGRLGFVMELIEGTPFDEWANSNREAPGGLKTIVGVVAEAADAIAFAHQRAVLHRDLKPSNVVVSREGRARILDFGLAKALDDPSGSFATVTGAFVGTLACAAPEQVSGSSEGPDVRTDVYGLGLLLYVGVAGRLPWEPGLSMLELSRAIREGDPPRPTSLSSVGNAELDAIALKAIAKDASRRYATAAAFAADLRRWLGGSPVEARFDSRWYVIRKTAWRHRRPLGVAAAALGGLAVFGALAVTARVARQRAMFAAAVRDARAVETHAVEVDRARAIARENFAAGEPLLWNALLDPDAAVVDAGLEGSKALAGLPSSPAYWGLWEVAMRRPTVVASWPRSLSRSAHFIDDDTVAGYDGDAIVHWNWRQGRLHRQPTPDELAADGRASARGGRGRLTFVSAGGGIILIDLLTGERKPVGDRIVRVLTLGRIGFVLVREQGPGEFGLELWSQENDFAGPLASTRLPWEAVWAATDPEGRFLVALGAGGGPGAWVPSPDGVLRGIALDHSEVGFDRVTWLASRGRAGEVLAGGADAVFCCSLVGDRLSVRRLPGSGGFTRATPRTIDPAPGGRRFVGVSDRQQLLTGDATMDDEAVRVEPAYLVTYATLAPDERHAFIAFEPDDRAGILDLDPRGVRRLDQAPHAGSVVTATVFDLRFSPDGRSLVSVAMDGSVRRHAVDSDQVEVMLPARPSKGLTRLACRGEEIFLGLHDLGRGDVPLEVLRDGQAQATGFVTRRWISGLEVSEDAVWILAGSGQLARLDASGATILAERNLDRHRNRPGFRVMIRLAHRGLLVAPTDPGVGLFDERSLQPVGAAIAVPTMYDIASCPSDPDLLAIAHDDGTIGLWRLSSSGQGAVAWKRLRLLRSHAGAVFGVAFHPAGRVLASIGGTPETKDVRFWDIETGRELASLDLFALGAFTLAFSPDGRWLAVGGEPDPRRAHEGGQLFLIDLHAAARAFIGNLDHHVVRLESERGRQPILLDEVRDWAESVRSSERLSESD